MGFALLVHARVGIKHVIGQVFPGEQQHGRHQEDHQLVEAHQLALAGPVARRQQHRHHRHRIHGPLDRRLPKPAPVRGGRALRRPRLRPRRGVKACDDLGLGHGGRLHQARKDPYI